MWTFIISRRKDRARIMVHNQVSWKGIGLFVQKKKKKLFYNLYYYF